MGGAWNQVTSAAYPTVHRMGIGIGLLLEPAQLGHVPLQISIVDQAGQAIVPDFQAMITVQATEAAAEHRAILAANLQFPLPRPGRYAVVVSFGPNLRRAASFEARLAPATVTVQ